MYTYIEKNVFLCGVCSCTFISLLGCPHQLQLEGERRKPEACCLKLCTSLQCSAVFFMQIFTQNNSFLNLWLDMGIFAQNASIMLWKIKKRHLNWNSTQTTHHTITMAVQNARHVFLVNINNNDWRAPKLCLTIILKCIQKWLRFPVRWDFPSDFFVNSFLLCFCVSDLYRGQCEEFWSFCMLVSFIHFALGMSRPYVTLWTSLSVWHFSSPMHVD